MAVSNPEIPTPLTVALLTPDGRGAIATIRIRGESRFAFADFPFQAANGRPLIEQDIRRTVFGRWGDDVPEDVVVCRIDDATLDVHCHGGHAAPRRIIHDLQQAGATLVSAAEMQELTVGRFQRDMLDALSRTRTLRTADIVLEQACGLLQNALRSLLTAVREESSSVAIELDALLQFAEFGRHLTEPWRVVVTGRPNVGKSSLINALVGYSRSIVFDHPGTTRDIVTAEAAFDGWPVELIDTAGLRHATESLEATGIERARAALHSANCRVLLLDVGEPLTPDDRDLLEGLTDPLVLAHKCDRPPAWSIDKLWNDFGVVALSVSSRTGVGLESLEQEIVRHLVPEIPAPGRAVPLTAMHCELLNAARDAILARRFDAAAARLVEIIGDR